MTPGIRSSGVVTGIYQQEDGRAELIGVQVNVLPVSAADDGNMDMVARALVATFNDYPTTMSKADIIDVLRFAANQLEKLVD